MRPAEVTSEPTGRRTGRGARLHDPRRLAALVDGVSAIAITLLVIDIAVPVVGMEGGSPALVDALIELWPSFLAYLIGFMAVGIWWLHHQSLFAYLKGVDGRFITLNLLLLLGIGFMPFTTALLADYMGAASDQTSVAVSVFAGWQLLTAVVFNAAWWHALHRARLVVVEVPRPARRKFYRTVWLGPIGWGLIAGLGFVSPPGAIVLILVLIVMWLVWIPRLDIPTPHPGTG